jgi:hypothetical protein
MIHCASLTGTKPQQTALTIRALLRDAVPVGFRLSEVFGVARSPPLRPFVFLVTIAATYFVDSIRPRMDSQDHAAILRPSDFVGLG